MSSIIRESLEYKMNACCSDFVLYLLPYLELLEFGERSIDDHWKNCAITNVKQYTEYFISRNRIQLQNRFFIDPIAAEKFKAAITRIEIKERVDKEDEEEGDEKQEVKNSKNRF